MKNAYANHGMCVIKCLFAYANFSVQVIDLGAIRPYAWNTNSLPIANGTISPYLLKLYYALARPLHQFYNMGALQLVSSAYIPYGEQALVN